MQVRYVALALAGGLSASTVVSAADVGVNFLGRNDGANALNATQTAGQVPQANWNNEAGSSGSPTVEVYKNLVDSTGAATPITLTANYNDSWTSGSGHASPDNTLLSGIIKIDASRQTPTGSLQWNNVPAGTYNVVLELAENGGGAHGMLSVGANTQTIAEVDGGTQTGPVTYMTDPTGTNLSNYALFSGVSPDSSGNITVNITDLGGSDGFGTAAIQLVPTGTVPEPATLGLLCLGVVGLIARRRRA